MGEIITLDFRVKRPPGIQGSSEVIYEFRVAYGFVGPVLFTVVNRFTCVKLKFGEYKLSNKYYNNDETIDEFPHIAMTAM